MGRKNTAGRVLIVMGAMLIAAALLLVIYNLLQSRHSSKEMTKALTELHRQIPADGGKGIQPAQTESPFMVFEEMGFEIDGIDNSGAEEEAPGEETDEAEDPVIELDGQYYMGLISLPSVEQEFPVIRGWSYPNLNVAPCRYAGSRIGRDLIICAHNYSGYFDRLQELTSGDSVIFTDINGRSFEYVVSYTELINGWDSPSMLRGGVTDWDLTLFTCTWSGYSRVTVRCELMDGEK